MREILRTEHPRLTIRTVYIEEEKTFSVLFDYPDGKEVRVEDVKDILVLVETHDFWCKYTGIISTPIKSSQVEKHLTALNLRAS